MTTKTKAFKCGALSHFARREIGCLGIATKTVRVPGALSGMVTVGRCAVCEAFESELSQVRHVECATSRTDLVNAVEAGEWFPGWLAQVNAAQGA